LKRPSNILRFPIKAGGITAGFFVPATVFGPNMLAAFRRNIAMQHKDCCYAKSSVELGIWYT
jgi:hypothetical protein